MTASRPAGKRRGGESELKRPNTTLRKLPAGTRPVPENEPDQLAPGASERGSGGAKASATSGGVVRPDASRCDARSSRAVGATKSPNFVPPDTCGLPIAHLAGVAFVTFASTSQPLGVICRRRTSSPKPTPPSPSSSLVPIRMICGGAAATPSFSPPQADPPTATALSTSKNTASDDRLRNVDQLTSDVQHIRGHSRMLAQPKAASFARRLVVPCRAGTTPWRTDTGTGRPLASLLTSRSTSGLPVMLMGHWSSLQLAPGALRSRLLRQRAGV